jgi:HEPN domain-containing protein
MTAEFDVEKTVEYWRLGAEYDLGVADALLAAGKNPYALFMGHLALEKLLKALVVKETGKHALYTHSLPMLAGKLAFAVPDRIKADLIVFMEFHSEARYPEAEREFYKKCTARFTKRNMAKIVRVFKWFRQRLETSS